MDNDVHKNDVFTSESTRVPREHKSRLFCFIFGQEKNKRWTLALYNSLHGTDYTDVDALEITTIENVVYLGMKNDLSYIVSDKMSLYSVMNINEQQSTYNPNMPIRELMYSARLYEKYVKRNGYNIYGTTIIPLPIPKLVVLYNGKTEVEDDVILTLDDSYREEIRNSVKQKEKVMSESDLNDRVEQILEEASPDISVRVRMININYGHNEDVMRRCRPLEEYAWFVDRIRNKPDDEDIGQAVDKAIDDMPKDYEIKELLVEQRSEVKGMLLEEYDEAEIEELFKEEGRREGKSESITKLATHYISNDPSLSEEDAVKMATEILA
ncbi:MAG: hypothetical protein K6G76_11940 [Lachnospiraceae bacterium]|nr:hypothetical protein [Lachnospiraceae bacterium]